MPIIPGPVTHVWDHQWPGPKPSIWTWRKLAGCQVLVNLGWSPCEDWIGHSCLLFNTKTPILGVLVSFFYEDEDEDEDDGDDDDDDDC